jgi:hypothetical protein
MADELRSALIAHASTPSVVVSSLLGRVSIQPGLLQLRYSLEADLSRLRVPPVGPGRRTDELWKHTCFEAFLAPVGGSAYHELNFSPSRDWAAYRFTAYRTGMAPAQLPAAPWIEVTRDNGRLSLDCRLAWPPLDLKDHGSARLRVALAAVIEAEDGKISYWAVKHVEGKPDFHHPDALALELTL